MIWYPEPFSSMVCPTAWGLAPKWLRHNSSLRMATSGEPHSSSSGENTRPTRALAWSTRNRGDVADAAAIRTGSPAPVRLTEKSSVSPTSLNDWFCSRYRV